MREIKFRGKTIEGEWVYGYYLVDEQHEKPRHCIWTRENVGDFIANDMILVDPKTVGQDTGLKDKNGKEIYEGDTVRWDDRSNGRYWRVGAIEYYNGRHRIFDVNTKRYFNFGGFAYQDSTEQDLEIIGNIHDNPELLGEV